MGLNFNLVGLILSLLVTNLSFSTHAPHEFMNRAAHVAATKAYLDSGRRDDAPLLLILNDLLSIQAAGLAANKAILVALRAQLGLEAKPTLENMIDEVQRLIIMINSLPVTSAVGGVAESKGGGAAGPSPDASIGGASGSRFSALASKPKDKDRDTGLNFYLSLTPGAGSLQLSVSGTPREPIIGFYDTGGYKIRMPLMVVEGAVDLLKHASSDLYAQVSDISADKVKFYINIWGPFFGENLPASNPNNVVFHEIVAQWTGLHEPFSVTINGGLFEPNGVINAGKYAPGNGGSIPFDSLQPIEINPHDGRWSPNNARFKLIDGRNIVSFWLVGKHDKHAVVTLNLIINSDSGGLGAKLIDDLKRSDNLATLIRGFDRSAERPARTERRTRPILPKPEAEDAQAVWGFTDVLEDMLAA